MEKPSQEISDADKIKLMALFMEQYNNQPGHVETVRMPAQTESPQQLVNATPIGDAQHLQPKNDFMTEERGRSVANQSKFYEAVSLLEDLESEDDNDIGIKLLKAECYIQLGRENKAEKTIKHIEIYFKKPPKCNVNDVIKLAKDFGESNNYVRAMILLRIAGDMFKDSELHPDKIVSGLSRCIKEMQEPVKKLLKGDNATSIEGSKGLQGILQSLLSQGVLTQEQVSTLSKSMESSKGLQGILQSLLSQGVLTQEQVSNLSTSMESSKGMQGTLQSLLAHDVLSQEQVSNLSKPVVSYSEKLVKINGRNKVIAFDYGIAVMEDMLDALQNVEGADVDAKVLKQAVLTQLVVLLYSTIGQHEKALRSIRGGLHLLEKHFGRNANQYQIYVVLLLDDSAEWHNLEKFKEAETSALKALDAVDHAADFSSEEERMTLIRRVHEVLNHMCNHVKHS